MQLQQHMSRPNVGGKCFVEAGWDLPLPGYARSQALGEESASGSLWSTWVPEQFQFDEAVSTHEGLTAKSCRLRLEQRHCVMRCTRELGSGGIMME